MNTAAYLNGKEYRYVETVSELDTSAQMIVCIDRDGNKFVCSLKTQAMRLRVYNIPRVIMTI